MRCETLIPWRMKKKSINKTFGSLLLETSIMKTPKRASWMGYDFKDFYWTSIKAHSN